MNPNAAIFYPKLSTQEVYSQIKKTPYMSSVIENLFFDNLENEFIKNNAFLFEDNDDDYFTKELVDHDNTKDLSKRKTLIVNTKTSKVTITFQ